MIEPILSIAHEDDYTQKHLAPVSHSVHIGLSPSSAPLHPGHTPLWKNTQRRKWTQGSTSAAPSTPHHSYCTLSLSLPSLNSHHSTRHTSSSCEDYIECEKATLSDILYILYMYVQPPHHPGFETSSAVLSLPLLQGISPLPLTSLHPLEETPLS